MRGIADQRQPVIGDPRGMMEAQRIGRARREQADLAEEAAHRRLRLGREIIVAQRQEARRIRPAGTDQTIAERWPSVIIGHRQQRERPRRIEDFIGDIARAAARGEASRRSHYDHIASGHSGSPAASLMPRPPNPDVRRRLLSAGLVLVHGRGFAASGVKDITDSAGVPKGSFYAYFASKEAFAAAILEHYWADIEQRLLPILEAKDSAQQRITRFFHELADEHEAGDFLLGA